MLRSWSLRSVPNDIPTIALASVVAAVTWTLLGVLVAALAGQTLQFLREWLLIQGTFAILAAAFLWLLSRSPLLGDALVSVAPPGPSSPRTSSPRTRVARVAVVLGIAVVGTASTTHLGFRVQAPSRYFMWLTCSIVCAAAGRITWHFAEVLASAAKLPTMEIEVFAYSPGETRSLRALATYYVTFGAAVTVGYLFAFVGTVANDWIGPPTLVRGVQALWPTIYVPCCVLLLVYPHLAIRRVVRKAKDELIGTYQTQINKILKSGVALGTSDIEQVNALADLIARVQSTPNVALRLPIVLTTVFTVLGNLASLFISQEALGKIVRERFTWP